MSEPVLRVTATPAALELIVKLEAKHGPLMFHQSGGCCDGSAPMCYPRGEFIVGDYDRLLGEIGGTPFYISGPQFEYWQHTALIIDVVPGRGGMFSVEGPEGVRFLTRSRLFSDVEWGGAAEGRRGESRVSGYRGHQLSHERMPGLALDPQPVRLSSRFADGPRRHH